MQSDTFLNNTDSEDEEYSSDNSTFMKGPTAGFTIEAPLGGTKLGFDYSYRPADPLQSVHTFGARILL